MSASSPASALAIPAGRWRIEPDASELTFRSRGMFGLAAVKGTFETYDGELTVDDTSVRGELRIDAKSLDTHNSRRDTHLRSADFFDVERHPTVTFTLTELRPGPDGRLLATGTLQIRDNRLKITAPTTVDLHDDHLHLSTDISVDRAAAGVGWSKLGMIKGPAHLHAHAVLRRDN